MRVYRAAGEFYGHLHAALQFGDLSMWRDNGAFFFKWEFSAGCRQYGRQFAIGDTELLYSRALPELAQDIARKWKSKEVEG